MSCHQNAVFVMILVCTNDWKVLAENGFKLEIHRSNASEALKMSWIHKHLKAISVYWINGELRKKEFWTVRAKKVDKF